MGIRIRNRKAHKNVTLNDPHRAIELVLASLLMRLLDDYAN